MASIHGLQSRRSFLKKRQAVKFSDYIDPISNIFIENCVEKKSSPERYVMALPIFDALKKVINDDGLFSEEIEKLEYISTQFHIKIDELLFYKIKGMLKVYDYIKICRFFRFLSLIFYKKLKDKLLEEGDVLIILRSIVLVFSQEHLLKIFSELFSENMLADFLEVFTYFPKKIKNIDLQYTPLIFLGEGYYCLTQLFIQSDNIRNALITHRERFYPDNTYEPLVDSSFEALKNKIPLTKKNYRLLEYEIDCIAITDNYIFIFEIKNTILPCNKAEERTTYDSIIKGANQLENIEFLIKREHAQISSDFNTNISNKKIKKCIILGTRALTGIVINDTSVRYINELTNFLLTGIGVKNFKETSLWINDCFNEDDLVNFVDKGGSSIEYAKLCHPYSLEYPFENKSFIKETYFIHLNEVIKTKKE